MRIGYSSCRCLSWVLASATACTSLTAQTAGSNGTASATTLAPPDRTTTYTLQPTSGTSKPFFDHGYVIQFKHQSVASGVANVFLYNSSGQLEQSIAIWPAGASQLLLTSVDVGAGKQLGFSGLVTKADGSKWAFIATASIDGSNPSYFGTGNFLATQITLTDDGTIWAIVAEKEQFNKNSDSTVTTKRWDNYDMLRHFSSAGALLQHFVPRYDLNVVYVEGHSADGGSNYQWNSYDENNQVTGNTRADSVWGYKDAWKFSRQVFLRSSGTNTVLYDGLHNRLCAMNAGQSGISCRYLASNTSNMTLTGFALFSDGRVFASIRSGQPGTNPQPGAYLPSGIHYLSLPSFSSSTIRWLRVGNTGRNAGIHSLFGADGTSLVYRALDENL